MRKLFFIGLGNPGDEFIGTRHNLGIAVLRAWWEQADVTIRQGVRAFFPGTFMNDSGQAVRMAMTKNGYAVDDILLIHDDLELALGEVLITPGGSAKGHNGVRSVHAALDTTDVARLRLGIGRPVDQVPVNRFVLGKFTQEENGLLTQQQQAAFELLDEYVTRSVEER